MEYNWADEADFAVTICDLEGVVIYRNRRSADTFSKYGELMGRSLKDCHSQASWDKIVQMMKRGESNTYSVEKGGIKKVIHQTPLLQDGNVNGMIEISVITPDNMKHFKRD